MNIKHGVSVRGLRPEILLGLLIAADTYAEHGELNRFYITSGTEPATGRKLGSRHNVGLAVDLRRPYKATEIVHELRGRLGDEYDVVLEKDHIHLEYEP